MEERRRFVRLDTRSDVSYTVLSSGVAKQTVAKDIGGGGICVFADQTLPPGTQLQVALTLPGREQPVNFTAEVVWSEQYEMIGKGERRRSIEAGLQFVEISPNDREAVMQHVILSLKPPTAPS